MDKIYLLERNIELIKSDLMALSNLYSDEDSCSDESRKRAMLHIDSVLYHTKEILTFGNLGGVFLRSVKGYYKSLLELYDTYTFNNLYWEDVYVEGMRLSQVLEDIRDSLSI